MFAAGSVLVKSGLDENQVRPAVAVFVEVLYL